MKFSGNADKGPKKRLFNFGDVLDSKGTLNIDFPTIKTKLL